MSIAHTYINIHIGIQIDRFIKNTNLLIILHLMLSYTVNIISLNTIITSIIIIIREYTF